MRSSRSRRGTALIAASILLAACGGPTPSATPGSPAPGPTSAGGGTADLRMAIADDPLTLIGLPADDAGRWVSRLTNATLYALDDHLRPVPMVATDLPSTSKDGLTWTVGVRPGVEFADGSSLTASDVAFSFRLMASRDCGQDPSTCSVVYTNLASVTATDPATVVLRLRAPYAPFLVTGLAAVPILPKAAVTASLARLLAATKGTDPKAVQAQSDRVAGALADAACTGDPSQPATCNPSAWIGVIQPILTKAGVALPDREAFAGGDGAVDLDGYGQALIDRLDALSATLTSTGTDQAAAALGLLDLAAHPVGAGPYAVSSYEPGRRVVLDRNEHYWRLRVGPPHVEMEIIPDPATAASALRQGDLDFLPDVTPDAVPSLQSDAGVRLSTFASSTYYFIAFNVRPGRIYSDPNLRQAFASCIDHDATVAAATAGAGVPIESDVAPASWAFDGSVPGWMDDVAGAKRLIESSGWTMGADGIYAKDGQPLSTTLWVRSSRPARLAFARLASGQLRRCGIELVVREADFASSILPFLAFPNDFDTYLGNGDASLDPDDYALFHSSQVPTKDAPDLGNLSGWSDPTTDRLIVQGRTTVDPGRRAEIYAQLQQRLHDGVPYYFLWADAGHRGYSRRLAAQPPDTIDLASPLDYWNMDAWTVGS